MSFIKTQGLTLMWACQLVHLTCQSVQLTVPIARPMARECVLPPQHTRTHYPDQPDTKTSPDLAGLQKKKCFQCF